MSLRNTHTKKRQRCIYYSYNSQILQCFCTLTQCTVFLYSIFLYGFAWYSQQAFKVRQLCEYALCQVRTCSTVKTYHFHYAEFCAAVFQKQQRKLYVRHAVIKTFYLLKLFIYSYAGDYSILVLTVLWKGDLSGACLDGFLGLVTQVKALFIVKQLCSLLGVKGSSQVT